MKEDKSIETQSQVHKNDIHNGVIFTGDSLVSVEEKKVIQN